jgi:hypothetical protein
MTYFPPLPLALRWGIQLIFPYSYTSGNSWILFQDGEKFPIITITYKNLLVAISLA